MKVSTSNSDRCLGDCLTAYDERILGIEPRFVGPLGMQTAGSPQTSDHPPAFRASDQLTLDKYLGVKGTPGSQV